MDTPNIIATCACLFLASVASVESASAQSAPVAFDDAYTTPQDENLSVDDPGVLANDEDADGDALTAILVDSSQAVGTLLLSPDGSFEYEPGSFVGVESFTYRANDGGLDSNPATVTFTVTPGSTATFYTDESLFLSGLAAQGFAPQLESFESDAVWGATRSPSTAPSVTSQGITWESPIGTSQVTTGPGPALHGSWGFFALPHGDYLAGPQCLTPGVCTDRWRGSSVDPLVAIGGWVNAAGSAKVGLYLDDEPTQSVGTAFVTSGRFIGVIAPAGFHAFEYRELEGVSTDAFYIFGDKFTFARGVVGAWTDLGGGSAGAFGVPSATGTGALTGGSVVSLDLAGAPPNEAALLWISTTSTPLPLLGGTLHAQPFSFQFVIVTDPSGDFLAAGNWPAGLPPGMELWFQFLVQDLSVPAGIILSNGLKAVTP